MYYTVYILFLYDSNELHRGYLPCCYEDVEALCIWDGDIEILLQRGGVLVGRNSPAAMRIQRSFIHGMGMQRSFIEGQGFGWAGLTCCYKDVEVHCTWDGDGWVYRGLGIWVGRNSPAAIRMQGSFRSSVSGAPTWDSGFTEGCSMNICRTKRRTELQQYNSPRYTGIWIGTEFRLLILYMYVVKYNVYNGI